MTRPRVAAVAVTHNRSAVLGETLRAVAAQTRPAECLYVVDNAGDHATGELLRTEFPDAVHLRMAENLGPSGGHARGIEAACQDGFDAFWLMDDDSPPQPNALATLIVAAEVSTRRAGIIGCQGGVIRFGLVRHVADPRRELRNREVADDLFAVEFVLLDGSLVFRRVVDAIGVPPVDYFTMMEDVEYPLRARRAGFDVLLAGRDLMRRRHLGSDPATDLWRSYYQSRNHVRMALDFRSPGLLFGCVVRQARFVVAALRAPDRRWERIKLRSRGVWDGLRRRMGRRVDPDSASI
jgi:rhamnopyranosyl-N-acetylglucosaminyl-diphospho-decaprenol beta-1,3/1,4-galactofuranosyltransferase